ncbi:MAG: hypothetical protein OWV35_10010 [Firmicutes bacterium]|nr:hypothetical protein [Bacillota bacterium]
MGLSVLLPAAAVALLAGADRSRGQRRLPWPPLLAGLLAAWQGPRPWDGVPAAVWAGGFWWWVRMLDGERRRRRTEEDGRRALGRLAYRLETGQAFPPALEDTLREAGIVWPAGADPGQVLRRLRDRWPGPDWEAVETGWMLVMRQGGSLTAVVQAADAAASRRERRRRRQEEEAQGRRTTLLVMALAPLLTTAVLALALPAFWRVLAATGGGVGVLTAVAAVSTTALAAAGRLGAGEG